MNAVESQTKMQVLPLRQSAGHRLKRIIMTRGELCLPGTVTYVRLPSLFHSFSSNLSCSLVRLRRWRYNLTLTARIIGHLLGRSGPSSSSLSPLSLSFSASVFISFPDKRAATKIEPSTPSGNDLIHLIHCPSDDSVACHRVTFQGFGPVW